MNYKDRETIYINRVISNFGTALFNRNIQFQAYLIYNHNHRYCILKYRYNL